MLALFIVSFIGLGYLGCCVHPGGDDFCQVFSVITSCFSC